MKYKCVNRRYIQQYKWRKRMECSADNSAATSIKYERCHTNLAKYEVGLKIRFLSKREK